MSSPQVSIILPVYNGAKYLRQTIESILTQSHQDFELIVVNDGSTDDSSKICSAYPSIRLIEQHNQGVPVARNNGAAAAGGQYIGFIDQDDTWVREKLELQVRLLAEQPRLGYTITRQRFFLTEGLVRPEWCQPEWLDRPLAGFAPSTLLLRKSLFFDLGTFDAQLPVGSDTDFFFRMKDAKIPFVQLDDVLVLKRIHGNNQSMAREHLRREIMETLRRSIHRQREQSNSTPTV